MLPFRSYKNDIWKIIPFFAAFVKGEAAFEKNFDFFLFSCDKTPSWLII